MFGRKKEKLFGNGIEPNCGYCTYCSDSGPGVPCRIGRTPEDGEACSQFSYDPLRRSPMGPPPLKKHSPDEFKL